MEKKREIVPGVESFVDHDGVEAVRLTRAQLREMPEELQADLKRGLEGKRAYLDGAPFRVVQADHPTIVRRRAAAKAERQEQERRRAERKRERQRRRDARRAR